MAPTDNLVQLTENLFWVKAPGRGKFPFCNGFLLTGKENILIDAGVGEKSIKAIDAQFGIDCLLISHSHPDHILFWHHLSDRRLIMPRETPDTICDLIQLGTRFAGTLEKARHWKHRVSDELGLKAMRLPDERYADGDLVGNDRIKLRAIHAPGHLNDHYCFFHQESGVLLSTDIDFDSFGPWYGNPESTIEHFKQSIENIRSLPFETICSSHKPPMDKTEGEQAIERYLDLFDVQKRKVFDLCRQPQSLQQMLTISPFYRNKLPNKAVQFIFEENMILKNLKLLEAEGAIILKNGFYQQL